MGALIQLVLNFLAPLFGKFFLSKVFKISLVVAFLAFFVGAVYAYIQGASAIVQVIAVAMPDLIVGIWGWVMPSNANACLISVGGAYMLRFFSNLYFAMLRDRQKVIAGK